MRKTSAWTKVPKNVLIVGGAGWKNIGDDLIAQALAKWVSAPERSIGIAGGPHPVLAAGDGEKIANLSGDLRSRINLAWRILKADHVLIGGGGLLDDRVPFFYRPFTRVAWLCRRTNTRYSFAGIGVGPLQDQGSKEAYRNAVDGAAKVYVRDYESKGRLANSGVRREIEVVPDPVLWGVDGMLAPAESTRYDMAINLRNWHTHQTPRKGYHGPTNDEIVVSVARAINDWVGPEGRVALVSMSGLSGDDDSTMLERLRAKLHTEHAQTYYGCTPSEAAEALESSALILGMRLHACLVGVRSGRKVVGLAYDPKVEQQGKSLGFPTVPLDVSFAVAGADSIIEALETASPTGGPVAGPALPWA